MGVYTRRVNIKIEVDLWEGGSKTDTLDITKSVLNYRFQKSIKTPMGSCQMAMLPQRTDTHILDIVKPMDVVRISEFGIVKFIGYVKRVSYSGSIARDGDPAREATITANQFGGLLQEASIGYAFGYAFGEDLLSAAAKLNKEMLDALVDGLKYSEVIALLADSFVTFLQDTGAGSFTTYLDAYLDVSTGLTASTVPLLPRQYDIYTGTEEVITFWQVAEQIAQRPFNELWIDNGPRKVFIDGSDVEFRDRSTLVFRETPFDGTVGGASTTAFQDLPEKVVDKDHLTRFDLARSMDEVYTIYSVKEATFQLSDIARVLLGQFEVDSERAGRYLFKPLITELFYTRFEAAQDTKVEAPASEVETTGKQYAQTLKAWFEHNDEYLSGAITMMVPDDNDLDPKIGDKIRVYGIEGFFYVEGIAHQWQYQGPLVSNLTVTRGWNRSQKIELKDRIFRRNQLK